MRGKGEEVRGRKQEGREVRMRERRGTSRGRGLTRGQISQPRSEFWPGACDDWLFPCVHTHLISSFSLLSSPILSSASPPHNSSSLRSLQTATARETVSV